MILLCERNEVVGFCLLQHTQRPNHVCLQKGLQASECILHNRVNLYRKMSIRDVVAGDYMSKHTDLGVVRANLAVELLCFAGLEVQSGKSHEQVTYLRSTVALTVYCVVLVKE